MTSLQVQDTEKNLWFNYYRQIANLLVGGGGSLGNDAVIYVAPLTNQGIASGDWIPTQVTNNQLYRVANSLLPVDSPVYVPGSTKGGYIQALQQYLNWVKLNGNPSQANIVRLTTALNASNKANAAFDTETDAAWAAYDKWVARNPTITLDFSTWAQTNRPTYFTKWQQMQAASAAVIKITQEIYGNDAAVLGQQMNALSNALGPIPIAGATMDSITADVTNIQANIDAAQEGNPPNINIQGVFQRPAYSMQGYKTQVNEWANNFDNQKPTVISFSNAASTSSSWTDYNFKHVNANGSFSTSWFFLSVRASTSVTGVTDRLKFDSASASIQVKITFTGLKTFEVAPGSWDVPNVHKTYPNVRDGTPPEILTNLVKTEKLLVGYGPGIEVTMDATSFSRAHDLCTKTTSSSGGVSLFGFSFGAGVNVSAQTTRTTATEDVKWNSATNTVTIKPQNDLYPVLIGVLGRRLV